MMLYIILVYVYSFDVRLDSWIIRMINYIRSVCGRYKT